MLKGTAAVLLAAHFAGPDGALAAAHDPALAAGLGAFLGHLFPVWLKFKGGKGVATYIGLLIGLYWPGALIFCAVWLLVAFATRFSSLAALLASALTPVALWALGQPRAALLFALLSALLWVMHRANIARLLTGSESKIGRSSAA
jgi:glycerol-3-phosphate acyltransferase PlsY